MAIITVGATGADYTTIQAAIGAATAGDTIQIAAGIYREQITVIGKTGLTIEAAAGAAVTIEMPDSPVFNHVAADGGTRDRAAVVTVRDSADIVLQGVMIDGRGRGEAMPASTAQADIEGVLYFDASGEISDVTVTGVRDPLNGDGTPKGNQRGNAIVVINSDSMARSVVIDGNTVEDFQKNGVSVSGAGLTATITANTVTGSGFLPASNAIAQNGIQISSGAGGEIDGNTVAEIGYQRGDFVTTGVLAFGAADGLKITNNDFTGATLEGVAQPTTHIGIYLIGETNNAVVTDNSFDELTFGVIASDDFDGLSAGSNSFTNMFASVMTNTGALDTWTGDNYEIYGADNDLPLSFMGSDGIDYIEGTPFDDTLTGGEGNDTIDGGGGIDTAVYAGDFADFTVALGATSVTVADDDTVAAGDEGTDTLEGVERLQFNDQIVLVVGAGGFATIQGAVDAAAGGEIILVAAGTYAENVTIDVPLTITGAGVAATVIAPGSGNAVTLAAGVAGAVTLQGLKLDGAGTAATGIRAAPDSEVALTVQDAAITGFSARGLFSSDNGDPTNTPGATSVTVRNVAFSNNGFGGANGAGNIKLFGFGGVAAFEDVTIAGASDSVVLTARPDNAIEIVGNIVNLGTANPAPANPPAANVTFDGVTVTGTFHKNAVALFHFSDLTSLSILDLDLSGVVRTGIPDEWGPVFNLDGITSDIDASGFGITYPTGLPIAAELQGEKQPNQGGPFSQTITGSAANEQLNGKQGADTLNGGGGDDALIGGEGDDTLNGGDGDDTAVYLGARGEFTVATTTNAAGFVTGFSGVDDTNMTLDEGTDTLSGVEILRFANYTAALTDDVVLDLTKPVQVFDMGGQLVGTFDTIQAGVTAASDFFEVRVAAGTYAENVTVDARIRLIGANESVPGLGERGAESRIEGSVTLASDDISITGFEFANATAAIRGGADGSVNYSGAAITNNRFVELTTNNQTFITNGFGAGGASSGADNWYIARNYFTGITGNDASAMRIDNVSTLTIEDNIIDHSVAASGRRGIQIDNGQDVTIQQNTIDLGVDDFSDVNAAFAAARYAVQLSMDDDGSLRTVSNVTITENTFSGSYDGVVTLDDGTLTGLDVFENLFNGSVFGVRLSAGSGAPAIGSQTGIAIQANNFSGVVRAAVAFDTRDPADDIGDVEVSGNIFPAGVKGVEFINEATRNIVDSLNLSGSEASDEMFGGSAVDTLSGFGGDDVFEGASGNDVITGGGGDDAIDGGAGIDTAVYAGDFADFTIALGATSVTVADDAPAAAGDEGTDTLEGVERLQFNDQIVLVVGAGGFATIQEAVDAAAGGEVILVAAGSYAGAVINKSVTIQGAKAGEAGYDALSTAGVARDATGETIITSTFVVPANVTQTTIDGFRFENIQAINVNPSVAAQSVTFVNNVIVDGGNQFFALTGADGAVVVSRNFIDSATGNGLQVNGDGAPADGTATITENLFNGTGTGAAAVNANSVADFTFSGNVVLNTNSHGIQVAGPMGDVVIDGNTFDNTVLGGAPDRGAISVSGPQNFTGALTITDNTVTNSPFGIAYRGGPDADSTARPATISGNDFSGVTVAAIGHTGTGSANVLTGGDEGSVFRGFAENDTFTGGGGDDAIDGGAGIDTAIYAGNFADFTVTLGATSFTVADDAPAAAGDEGTDTLTGAERLEFDGQTVLVVGAGGFATIQAAVDAATGGEIILVAAGIYAEDLTIAKDVQILGPNAALTGDDAARGDEAVIDGKVTISSDASLSGFTFLNNEPTGARGQLNLVTVTGGDVGIANSIFLSTVAGGGTGGVHDVAVFLNALGAGDAVSITGNLFTGDGTFSDGAKYSTAAWGRGVWSNGGADALTIDDNSFRNTRTGINLENYNNAASSVSGNSFVDAGTGIAIGAPTAGALTTITNNSFQDVDTDFNARNLSGAVQFDLGATGNAALAGDSTFYSDAGLILGNDSGDLDDPDGTLVYLSGAGADTITGTDGNDRLVGDDLGSADDVLKGGGGDDAIVGGGGNDIAVYAGAFADFSVARNGTVTVSDLNAADGDEGTDTLTGVETLRFGDQDRHVFLAANDTGIGIENLPTFVDLLANDGDFNNDGVVNASDVAIKPNSVMLEGADDASGKVRTVAGEGVWTVAPIGANGRDLLIFQPETNFFGPPTPVFYTVEGTDNVRSLAARVNVDIANINDAPVNTTPATATVAEDGTLAFTGAKAVSVLDVDGDTLTTTLSVSQGVLSVDDSGFATVSGDGTANVIVSGFEAEVNAALAGLTYAPNADFFGEDTLTVMTSDGTLSDTDEVAITVTAVNDAPVNTVPGEQVTDEDAPLAISGVSVADIDDDALTTMLAVSFGVLSVAAAGAAGVTGNGTAEVVISGLVADVNDTLASLNYAPDADFFGDDTLTVTTSDGNLQDVDMIDIVVNPVNDAPVASASSAPDVTAAGGATTIVTVTFADIDGVIAIGSLGVTDIVVTGPDGPLLVTGISVSPAGDGTPRTASYTVAAPGGAWDLADNGLYSVALAAGEVFDNEGLAAAAGVLTTFTVAVPDTPPPAEPFRVEAEDFALSGGFVVRARSSASDGANIESFGGGEATATFVFDRADGVYDLGLGYFDENDGVASMRVLVNGSEIDSFLWNADTGFANPATGALVERAILGVALETGDVIELKGTGATGEPVRTDYLDFTFVDELIS